MDLNEAQERCICPTCPTYRRCDEPVAFCFREVGKSRCIEEEHGCMCPSCTVHVREGFQHNYYCLRGSESEQHG